MERKMQHIPNDIIGEILLRLSAKSLLRLRWACKYWFDLITRNPDFIKINLHRSTTTHDNDETLTNISSSVLSFSYRTYSCSSSDVYQLFQCSLEYNDTTRSVGDVSSEVCIALPFDYPLRCCPEILGSCNGLILMQYSEKFCIWNPCTKEYKILPHPGVLGNPHHYYHFYHYGFGYDDTTDDYKLLVIRNSYYYNGNGYFNEFDGYSYVQVYTLRTNSWRRVDGSPKQYRFWRYEKEGMFVNGAFYWIGHREKNVISFDIGKEKFMHESEAPDHSHVDFWYYGRMQVFERFLCKVLRIKEKQNYRAEIWVMKDYAEKNNKKSLWTKLSTIENLRNRLFPIKPLRFTRNSEILMMINQKDLLLYDLKNSNLKTLCKICEHRNRHLIDVNTESLVSLNSGTYMGQERRREQQEEDAPHKYQCSSSVSNQNKNKNEEKNKPRT